MKNVRKIITVILICALSLVVTACSSSKAYTHGTSSGTTYTSSFLGVKAEFGSDWTLSDAASLAKMNGLSDMTESSTKSSFEKNGIVVDMYAVRQLDNSNINIVVEDVKKTYGKSLSEDEYYKKGLETVKTQMSAIDSSAQITEGKTDFLGKSTRCFNISVNIGGVNIYERQVPIFRGDYVSVITFSSLSSSELDSLVGVFNNI